MSKILFLNIFTPVDDGKGVELRPDGVVWCVVWLVLSVTGGVNCESDRE